MGFMLTGTGINFSASQPVTIIRNPIAVIKEVCLCLSPSVHQKRLKCNLKFLTHTLGCSIVPSKDIRVEFVRASM
jgi:hypothetical protein